MVIGIESGLLLAVYLALVLFGIGYNYLTQWAQARGYAEGFVSLLVVGGVLVTIAASAILIQEQALIVLGSFTASGLPMVCGSLWRYIQSRENARKAMLNDKAATTRK